MTRKSISEKSPAAAPPPAGAALAALEETWPVDRLKPYDRNARRHPKKQIEQLREIIRKFGQVWPILVREDGRIIAGHGRLEAFKAEGYTEVRVIVARGWSEEQCRAFALWDNQSALNSQWDKTMLGQELADLGVLGIDAKSLGFDPKAIASIMPGRVNGGNTDPNAAPALAEKTVAQPGDIWLLGGHRLGCGDCTNPVFVGRVLAGAQPNLMVTDPPYGVNYDPAWRARVGLSEEVAAGKVKNDDQADWRHAWSLFPGAVAYVWHGGLHGAAVTRSLEACGFQVRAQIIWNKPRFALSRGNYHWQHEPAFYAVKEGADDGWRFVPEHEAATYAVAKGRPADWMGGRAQSTVWEIEHVKNDTGHGTQKPIECMKRPILNNSVAGDVVYEPFAGSGTTIIAAEMTERRCCALELDPMYADVIVRRWQEFTGKKATLDGDGRAFDEIAAERLGPKAA